MASKGRAALALRLAGASYSEIAETVGYNTPGDARKSVVRELGDYEADDESRTFLRTEEAARIERLIRSVWGKATNPNDPEHLVAVKTAAGLIERHSRLLGLDAPQEVLVYNPTAVEIDQWVAQMIGQTSGPEVIEGEVLGIEARSGG